MLRRLEPIALLKDTYFAAENPTMNAECCCFACVRCGKLDNVYVKEGAAESQSLRRVIYQIIGNEGLVSFVRSKHLLCTNSDIDCC